MEKINTFVNVKVVFRAGKELLYFTSTDGHKNLPGGHLEHGEQPLAGLQREVREELGFDFEREPQPLGAWTSVNKSKDIHRITIAYLYDLPAKTDFVWEGGPQDENFESLVWISGDKIRELGFSPKYLEIMNRAATAPHR